MLTLTNRQLQNRLLMARSCDDHVLPLRRRDVRIAWRACLWPNPIQYNTREKRKDVQKWCNDSAATCMATIWLEKEEAAYWLFACILRKIDVWTATWSQCWSMLDSLNKCYGQWVRILASMAGRNFLDTGPQHPPHVTTAAPKKGHCQRPFPCTREGSATGSKDTKMIQNALPTTTRVSADNEREPRQTKQK